MAYTEWTNFTVENCQLVDRYEVGAMPDIAKDCFINFGTYVNEMLTNSTLAGLFDGVATQEEILDLVDRIEQTGMISSDNEFNQYMVAPGYLSGTNKYTMNFSGIQGSMPSSALTTTSYISNRRIIYSNEGDVVLWTGGSGYPLNTIDNEKPVPETIFYFGLRTVQNMGGSSDIILMPELDGSQNEQITMAEFKTRYGDLLTNQQMGSPTLYYREQGSTSARTYTALNSTYYGSVKQRMYGIKMPLTIRQSNSPTSEVIANVNVAQLYRPCSFCQELRITPSISQRQCHLWALEGASANQYQDGLTLHIPNATYNHQLALNFAFPWVLYKNGYLTAPPFLGILNPGYSPVHRGIMMATTPELWEKLWHDLGIYGTYNSTEAQSVDIRDWQYGNTSIIDPDTGGEIFGGGGYVPPQAGEYGDEPEPLPGWNPVAYGATYGGGTPQGWEGTFIPPDGSTHTSITGPDQYILSVGEFEHLGMMLSNGTLWLNFSSWFRDPKSALIGAYIFPFNVKTVTGTNTELETVKIGGVALSVADTAVEGYPMAVNENTRIQMGSIRIQENFGSYLDYDPYTKIQLFLPYCGFVDIPTDMFMNRTLSVYYDVSYDDGSCRAFILADGVVIVTKDINISEKLQLASSDIADILQKQTVQQLSMLGTWGAAMATGGKSLHAPKKEERTSLISSKDVVDTTGSLLGSFMDKAHFSAMGSSEGNHGRAMSQVPFLIITRPLQVMSEHYVEREGLPTFITPVLSDLRGTGFTQCKDITLNGPGFENATESEKDTIKALLNRGVFL